MIYTFRDWASCKYVGNLKRTVPVFWDPRRGMYVKAVPYPPGTVDAEGKVVPLATVDDERHGRISSLTAYHNAEHREQRRSVRALRGALLYCLLLFIIVVSFKGSLLLVEVIAGIVIGIALGVYCGWWWTRGYLIKDSYVFPASDREVTLALIGSRDKYRFGSSALYWCGPVMLLCWLLLLGFVFFNGNSSSFSPGLGKILAAIGITIFVLTVIYLVYALTYQAHA
ncbi:hypothetical protein PSRA_1533 [Pseudoscardovia radai]|uniref:Uncharacterized protein n=1 Tax=Pseudoscardovia radai TaxID=987066 RepID=A0A261ESA7_9BIFI|nr:hypothetical protein [Pseudoscardovia radai]OZG49728.1 hypothetical protein PSRA_1533 [Pseudoscardovia radai]